MHGHMNVKFTTKLLVEIMLCLNGPMINASNIWTVMLHL